MLGTLLGGLVCWMRMSRCRWLQQVARVYIDLIRSRTFDAFFPLIVTAIIYFLVAWLIGLLLQSLVQRQQQHPRRLDY